MYLLKTFKSKTEEPRQVKPAYLDHHFKPKSISFFYSVCIIELYGLGITIIVHLSQGPVVTIQLDITAKKIRSEKRPWSMW